MEEKDYRNSLVAGLGLLLSILSIVAVFLFNRRTKKSRERTEQIRPFTPAVHEDISGLSNEQVQSRKQKNLDNSISFKPRRSTKEIFQKNIFSIFNLSLLGIAFVQLLLGRWTDVLISLGVMALNIGVNIFQELFARRRLKQIISATRLETTVIRENQLSSVDPNELVIGDIVLIGPGDQMVVDGEIVGNGKVVVDETLITGKNEKFLKKEGDKVYAGGYCISGRGAFEVQKMGDERAIYSVLKRQKYPPEQLTPLETIIERVLKGLLVIVAVLTVVILMIYFELDLGISSDVVNSAISVVFSIAPAGLFFMILVTYAAGTADIGKIGALVNRARSVEFLAQINEVCIVKTGFLTGIDFEIETTGLNSTNLTISSTRIRQWLGDFVHSSSSSAQYISILSNSLEGTRRKFSEEMPFINVYGWSSLSIEEDDMYGVFVLGSKDVLTPFMQTDTENLQEEKTAGRGISKTVSRITKFFRGRNQNAEPGTENFHKTSTLSAAQIDFSETGTENDELSDKPKNEGVFHRISSRIGKVFRRDESDKINLDFETPQQVPVDEYLFAYLPDVIKIYDDRMIPHLPDGLLPLANIEFREDVIQSADQAVKDLSKSGLKIKILSRDVLEGTSQILEETGLNQNHDQTFSTLSGTDLEIMTNEELREAMDKNLLITSIQPKLVRKILTTLRGLGRNIAIIGNGVKDVPALINGDLAIVRLDSDQAALMVSDIVLLNNQLDLLGKVLEKGQKIVAGLLNILKLYLTQASYLALLIVWTLLFSRGFPYKSTQGSLVAVVTITIPALGLTFFAKPGVKDGSKFSSSLSKFVVPAAVSISAAASVVFNYFYELSGEISYAQLTVTYFLVYAGLVLVIYVSPPLKILAAGAEFTGDWRPTILAFLLVNAFMIVAPLRITEHFLDLKVLQNYQHYGLIATTVVIWAFVLQILWRLYPIRLGIDKSGVQIK